MKTVVYPTIFTNGFTVKTAGSSRGHINDAAGKLVKKILLNSGLNSIKLINLACGIMYWYWKTDKNLKL